MKILFATENAAKVQEVRGIFEQKLPQAELVCIADLPPDIREKYEAHETGYTYAENALIKARALAKLADGVILADAQTASVPASAQIHPWILADTKTASVPASAQIHPWILAEDSGFEVEALGRAPGIYSSRYAPTDAERCEKLLAALQNVPASRRRAQFVACVTLLEHGRNPIFFFGRRSGTVATERRGANGFGYDPIFIPDGETQTWGETPEESKILLSHRGIAMRLAIEYLVVSLSQNGEQTDQSSRLKKQLP